MPPFDDWISASSRRVTSTSSVGRSTSSFIKSRRFVPPARNFALVLAATSWTACEVSLALEYLNGRIAGRLLCQYVIDRICQLGLRLVEVPRPRCLLAAMDLLDCFDDVRIGTAATDVAAHPFPDFIIGELDTARLQPDSCGDIAGLSVFRFIQHRDR